jgi:hypothetical protein
METRIASETLINKSLENNLKRMLLGKEPGKKIELLEGELVVCGNIILKTKLFRFAKSFSDDFLLSLLLNQSGEIIWEFTKENFKGRGLLYMLERTREFVIVLEQWRGKLARVIPVQDLLKGKRDIGELINIKEMAAKELGMKPILSAEENLFLNGQHEAQERKRKEKIQQEKIQRQAEDELSREIRNRPEVYVVICSNGRAVRGIPVTRDEWVHLRPPDTGIIVEEYLPGQFMKATEIFRVKRDKQDNLIKDFIRKVFPKATPIDIFLAIRLGEAFFQVTDNNFSQLPVFSNENLSQSQVAELGNRKMFAVKEEHNEERFKIWKFFKGRFYSMGYFTPAADICFAP